MHLGWLAVVGLLGAAPEPVDGGSPGALAGMKANRPIHIDADKLEVAGKKNQMIWRGHVKAKRDDVDLSCDKMTVFYRGNQENVTRLLCDGNVEVTEGDRWGHGEHADFDNVKAVLVFTGNPEGKEGGNHFHGSKVTFYVGTDLMDVEKPDAYLEDSSQAGNSLPKGGSKKPKPRK